MKQFQSVTQIFLNCFSRCGKMNGDRSPFLLFFPFSTQNANGFFQGGAQLWSINKWSKGRYTAENSDKNVVGIYRGPLISGIGIFFFWLLGSFSGPSDPDHRGTNVVQCLLNKNLKHLGNDWEQRERKGRTYTPQLRILLTLIDNPAYKSHFWQWRSITLEKVSYLNIIEGPTQ